MASHLLICPPSAGYVVACYPALLFPLIGEDHVHRLPREDSRRKSRRLAKVSDAQLFEHGKTLRQFCRRVPGQKIDRVWLMQLNEDRAEGKWRHPTRKVR
jgi:hypothetical protein